MYFHHQQGELCAEQVRLTHIATQYGTPCYVYSHQALVDNWQAFADGFKHRPHRICYAVKANSNLAILRLFAERHSGFDIVSVGELERVLAAGGDPKKIVFSGVGKTTSEIMRALEVGISCFNIESAAELERINSLAGKLKKIAPVALRINPNIDAGTHHYIATGLNENKFGIAYDQVLPLVDKLTALKHVKLIGIGCHIGSQITELKPFLAAVERLLEMYQQLLAKRIELQHLNIGGGLGVCYQNETPPAIKDYAAVLTQKLAGIPQEIFLEPGRAIVANTGILLTRVEYIKSSEYKNFAIIDAAMNDLVRPALYDAWHNIVPVKKSNAAEKIYDVVGPICESGDFLGKNRMLAIQQDDLLAIHSAGAYGFSMSSNYNSRPRVAEILVHGATIRVIRERETIQDLLRHENILLS